ncbi:MAG: phosphotransferase enzyme family protein [Candidatus Zipacnadales bacterium]
MTLSLSEAEVVRVLPYWDVGALLSVSTEGSGTANPAVVIETAAGRFFLKRRHPRYSMPQQLHHDHALMEHLANKGLCTPLAVRARNGQRWVEVEGYVYELYPYMPGEVHDPHNKEQVREAGRVLARLHRATESFTPPPGKVWPRYHAPAQIIEALEWALAQLANCRKPTPSGRNVVKATQEIARLLALAQQLAHTFTEADYASCPRVLIHGDWHPTNVRYHQDSICCIFDLDWATIQPRLVDIADGVLFFAGRRRTPFQGNDIRSLTQPFSLDPEWTELFLEAYTGTVPLEPQEWALLPRFMLTRWLFCRADPMRRKIPSHEAIDYLLDGIWGPIREIIRTDIDHFWKR